MIHLGDITKIDWATVHPVDVVTGGSPCQDLSIAGKRAGLAGERSGLFIEQIRCVKELRAHDAARGRAAQFVRPRYMVWENVPGALSSNKGKDFGAVLEETVRVIEPEIPAIPVPEKGWPRAGCLRSMDGRWSVAWRVHDAQFWGVPQRRRRIALVADFGGMSAPEVLFERKGMSWDSDEGGTPWEETTGDSGKCSDKTISIHLTQHPVVSIEKTPCLSAGSSTHGQAVIGVAAFSAGQGAKAKGIGYSVEKAPSLKAANSGTNMVPVVYDARGNGNGKTVCTITGDHESWVTDYTALCIGNGQLNQIYMSEQAGTLTCAHDQQAVLCAALDCRNLRETEQSGTLQSKANGGYSLNYQNPVRIGSSVRRMTPLECERLQGYPDGWTDISEFTDKYGITHPTKGWTDSNGKWHKEADSPRYKALGNSIALPFWKWLLKRISAQYERSATLGSLFDGIGGFPLCWEQINGKGSALWASEIEAFPIAVTQMRFGGEIL